MVKIFTLFFTDLRLFFCKYVLCSELWKKLGEHCVSSGVFGTMRLRMKAMFCNVDSADAQLNPSDPAALKMHFASYTIAPIAYTQLQYSAHRNVHYGLFMTMRRQMALSLLAWPCRHDTKDLSDSSCYVVTLTRLELTGVWPLLSAPDRERERWTQTKCLVTGVSVPEWKKTGQKAPHFCYSGYFSCAGLGSKCQVKTYLDYNT